MVLFSSATSFSPSNISSNPDENYRGSQMQPTLALRVDADVGFLVSCVASIAKEALIKSNLFKGCSLGDKII